MCSIFPFQNAFLACSFSIQGLSNKISVLFLQIQGVFKEKVIFKEFSRTEQFFQKYSRPMRTMLLFPVSIAVITVTSGLDTQTRLMGHFPLY